MMESVAVKNRILVIDDSEVLLEMVRQTLDGTYEIFCFSQSPDAILQMREIAPDLVLMDYEMPNLNGLEVIRWMRSTDSVKNIPVIFLTSFYDVKIELEAFKIGAADYIHKPFSPTLLLKRIEMQLAYVQKQAAIEDDAKKELSKAVLQAQNYKEQFMAIGDVLANLTAHRTFANSVCKTVKYFSALLCAASEEEIYKELLQDEDKDMLAQAATLYDIGKLCINDSILQSPNKLTESEYNCVKEHTVLGYELLQKALLHTTYKEYLNAAAIIAFTHHENWDGTGYPKGLEKEEIPLVGRIMAVADTYNALTSPRAWRGALSHDEAISQIVKNANKKYDPTIVKLMQKNSLQLKALLNT